MGAGREPAALNQQTTPTKMRETKQTSPPGGVSLGQTLDIFPRWAKKSKKGRCQRQLNLTKCGDCWIFRQVSRKSQENGLFLHQILGFFRSMTISSKFGRNLPIDKSPGGAEKEGKLEFFAEQAKKPTFRQIKRRNAR